MSVIATTVDPNFNHWLREQGVVKEGQRWLLARPSAHLRSRYGEDTVFLSKARHDELNQQHKDALRDQTLDAIANEFHVPATYEDALVAAFKAGQIAR